MLFTTLTTTARLNRPTPSHAFDLQPELGCSGKADITRLGEHGPCWPYQGFFIFKSSFRTASCLPRRPLCVGCDEFHQSLPNMTDLGGAEAEPPPAVGRWDSILKHLGRPVGETLPLTPEPEQIIHEKGQDEQPRALEPLGEQDSKRVVTGLPRSQTFKRQLSEQRMHLEPVIPTADERRAASADRRCAELNKGQTIPPYADTQSNAPEPLSTNASVDGYGFSEYTHHFPGNHSYYELSNHVMDPVLFDSESRYGDVQPSDTHSMTDAVSISPSELEAMIADELAQKWILNLSMHFRDRSQREKFFVTYREHENLWRRVTISLDYRDAPPDSLEMDLANTAVQREKSAKIYEAIRDSLADIKFYPTVTNLKLETTGGRLHVHVVEDGNVCIDPVGITIWFSALVPSAMTAESNGIRIGDY